MAREFEVIDGVPHVVFGLEELRAVAYHEAGHAVAAAVCGYPFTEVWLLPDGRHAPTDDGDGLGASASMGALRCPNLGTLLGIPDDAPPEVWAAAAANRLLFWHRIGILLAGPVAEARFTGQTNWPGWESDLCVVHFLGRALAPRSPRYVHDVLCPPLRALVAEEWAAIAFVADHLLELRTLSARQVFTLVNEARRREGRGPLAAPVPP